MADGKITGMLASALEKLAAQPSIVLDLVATVADPAVDRENLAKLVQAHGGEVVRMTPEGVQLRLPVAAVPRFAESEIVNTLRMARLARMH